MDLEDELLFLIMLNWYVKRKSLRRIQRIREDTPALSGHAYTQQLLRRPNTQCQELMRISHEAYVLICSHFKQRNWLQDDRHITVEEKIAMFLTIIGHNEHFRMVEQRFQHSTQTIHKCFYEVLQGMMKLAREEFAKDVVGPTSSDTTWNMSNRHKSLRKMFSGAIGAHDGILVPAIVHAGHEIAYRRRGDQCYQNVLATCDFNMLFTFVWAGWEGASHDARVLTEVVFSRTSGFPIPPPDKYYLCDAEYDNTRGFLAPYRNTLRHHCANFRSQGNTTKEKRFNHVHAHLRNVIECAYIVLKERFPVLKQMIPLPFSKQRDVVIACFTIHNFIRRRNIDDQLFKECHENAALVEEQQYAGIGEERPDGTQWDAQDKQYMDSLRDEIANQLVVNGLS